MLGIGMTADKHSHLTRGFNCTGHKWQAAFCHRPRMCAR